ncbi:hypothetical protein [Hydrogenophaga sp.]|uniref:hypothetical protein n=1 Tax=Hydrogenophaga sp. TaxID=1904254 RepID=UPI002FCBA3F6
MKPPALPAHDPRDHWVAGRSGARYAVSVRNATPGRVLGVISVDGADVNGTDARGRNALMLAAQRGAAFAGRTRPALRSVATMAT